MPDKPISKTGGASTARRNLALRFISGKYQGGEFPLEEGQQIVIGRSSDLDMVLVEEMVSRRHARVEMHGGVVTIQDLRSTNGTFVNGEKVQRAVLSEGDRVLIGTSILKLVALDRRVTRSPSLAPVNQRRPEPAEAPRMTGNLEEIPLPDLLQLFGTSRKNGVLVLKAPSLTGRIYLKEGVLHFAQIDKVPSIGPRKAVFRMLGWQKGVFELEPPEQRQHAEPLDASAQEVLMEGFRQLDELKNLVGHLPAMESRLALKTPLDAPLHELEPAHLEILQLALNCPNLGALFDKTTVSDLEVAQIVLSLMKRGYVEPVPA